MRCGAIIQHRCNQLLQLHIRGVLQLVGGIGDGTVGRQLGIDIASIRQLCIAGQIDGVAQILGIDTLRACIVTVVDLIITEARDHKVCIFHIPLVHLVLIGDHAHLLYIFDIFRSEEGDDANHILKLQRRSG